MRWDYKASRWVCSDWPGRSWLLKVLDVMFLPLLGLFYGAITADMVSVKNMQISRSVLLNLKKSKINSLRPVDKIWRQNFSPRRSFRRLIYTSARRRWWCGTTRPDVCGCPLSAGGLIKIKHFVFNFCRDSESFPFWTSTDNLRCQPVDENHAWTTSRTRPIYVKFFSTKFLRWAVSREWSKQFFYNFVGGPTILPPCPWGGGQIGFWLVLKVYIGPFACLSLYSCP